MKFSWGFKAAKDSKAADEKCPDAPVGSESFVWLYDAQS